MNKRIRSLVTLCIAALALVSTAPAYAQDEPAPADEAPAPEGTDEGGTEDDVMGAIEEAAEEAPDQTTGATPDPTAKPPSSDDAPEADPLDELEPGDKLYWSTVRNIYTLQQRRFRKSKRFGVTVYGGLIPNNIFEQYVPVGLRLNYFILENIGVELAGSYNLKKPTGLENQIREEDGIGAGQVLIGDTQVSHTNFGIVWSPFYGKAAFYNSGLLHFDLFLFAGAGVVVAQTQEQFNADPTTGVKAEGALGGGLAVFLGDHFAGRVDFRQFVFQKVVGGVANPSEVSLGVSFFF